MDARLKSRMGASGAALLLPVAVLLAGCAGMRTEPPRPVLPAVDVPAHVETTPVGTARDDAADDPAIWRNAADPAASLILGTDKKAGLYVYGLDGQVRDFVAAGALNNVDLREVTLNDGRGLILVGASDRTDGAHPHIALFALDGTTGRLRALGSSAFLPAGHAPVEAYGFCMGTARAAGELARAYVVLKDGEIAEARLVERDGGIAPEYIRSMRLATQSEGCVVDDLTGQLFVAEEDVGIWRFDLAQAAPVAARYASVGAADGLVDDVEGLAIARQADGRAWLIASSQGDNAYALYDLATGRLDWRFRIQGGAIDGTSDTDGIDVAPGDFGPAFPQGIFVAQDGDNSPQAQNFKLLDWRAILASRPGD